MAARHGWIAALAAVTALAGGPAPAQDTDPNGLEFRIKAFHFAMRADTLPPRRMAMCQLAMVCHPRVVDALAPYLRDPDDELAALAARAIAHSAWGLADDARGDAVRVLLRALAQHDEARPAVAEVIVGALGDLGDRRVLATLIKDLRATDAGVALAAIDALGRIGDAEAAEPLLAELTRQHEAAERGGAAAERARAAVARLRPAFTACSGADPPALRTWRTWWRTARAAAEARSAARLGPPPGRAARRPELPALTLGAAAPNVDDAVRRACRWLIEELDTTVRTEYGGRVRPLALLALAHAGHAEDPAVAKALDDLGFGPLPVQTYDMALQLLALERADARRWQQPIARRAWWLVNAQQQRGHWGYSGPHPSDVPARFSPSNTARTRFPGVQLTGQRAKAGTPDPHLVVERRAAWTDTGGDLSNTQFAVLGLHAAERAHVRCPTLTWERIEQCYLTSAQDGWGYVVAPSSASASMTAGGLSSLACVREVLETRSPERDTAVAAAFAAFDRLNIYAGTDARQPRLIGPDPFSNLHGFYQLYSLERACVLWDRPELAGRDWYAAFARPLLEAQQRDGSWSAGGGRPQVRAPRRVLAPTGGSALHTAFAVLFLVKAAPEQRTPPTQITRSAFGKKEPSEPGAGTPPADGPSPGGAEGTPPPAGDDDGSTTDQPRS